MELLERIKAIVAGSGPLEPDAAGFAARAALVIEDPRNDGQALREAILLLAGLMTGGKADAVALDAIVGQFAREFHLGPRLSRSSRSLAPPSVNGVTHWAELARRYPWPAFPVGETSAESERQFSRPGSALLLNEAIRLFRPRLIAEVASGGGESACYILGRSDARLVAIDAWLPDAERPPFPLSSERYDAFVQNAWQYRDRIVPMRTAAIAAFHQLRAFRLEPEVVFQRGDGHPRLVAAELDAARRLFPRAKVIVEGYAPGRPHCRPVVDAVDAFAAEHRAEVVVAEGTACLLLSRSG